MKSPTAVSLVSVFFLSGCASTKVTSSGGPDIAKAQAESYNGPRARIAVKSFEDKTGKGKVTSEIGSGMADMLATALFHTNRFIVVERNTLADVIEEQDLALKGRIKKETAAPIGEIEGAELLIQGAVTEFEPGSGGVGAGIAGGNIFSVVGGVVSSVQKSHVAIDIRVVDTRTSRVVATASVEGSSTGFSVNGLLFGRSAGGGAGAYAKMPSEKAIRKTINEAVNFIVKNTPPEYFHYGLAAAEKDGDEAQVKKEDRQAGQEQNRLAAKNLPYQD